eukprot:1184046-Prorocentrum_minimum.AAC.1
MFVAQGKYEEKKHEALKFKSKLASTVARQSRIGMLPGADTASLGCRLRYTKLEAMYAAAQNVQNSK